MKIPVKIWQTDMTLKILYIFTFFAFTELLLFDSFAVAQYSREDGIEFNYTIYSTKIEFEIDYETYTITDISCDHLANKRPQKNSDLIGCYGLEPCTTYVITVRVKLFASNNSIEQAIKLQTDYERPSTKMNDPMPYWNSIYLSWNSSNANCIKVIKIETIGEDGSVSSHQNPGDDITIENLKPCLEYRITMTVTDINANIVGNETKSEKTTETDPGPVNDVTIDTTGPAVNVTWTPPKYATCADFYYFSWIKADCNTIDKELCQPEYKNVSVTERQLIIEDLEGCQNYTLKISVNGGEASSSIHDFSIFSVPGPVAKLSEEFVGSTNITVKWDKPELNGLCVQYYTTQISNDEEYYNTTDTFIMFEDLIPCADYNISVAPVSCDETVGPWQTINFTMDSDTPSEIRNVIATPHPSQVRITWDEPEFANLCIHEYRIAAWYKVDNTTHHEVDNVTEENFVVLTNLIACTTYTVQIIAVNKMSKDGLPYSFEVTTLSARLDSVVIVGVEPYRRKVKITAANTDVKNACKILNARFTCRTSEDVKIKRAEIIIPITVSHITGFVEPLSPDTTYVCDASIYNIGGWSEIKPPNQAVTKTLQDYPDAPTNLKATFVSSNAFKVSWEPPRYRNGNLVLYQLHIQPIGPKYKIPTYCPEIKLNDFTHPIDASVTEYSFDDVSPYVEYSIQVAAMNEVGVSEFSDPLIIVTKPDRSDPVMEFGVKSIEGPALSEIYKSNVTLKWRLPCRLRGNLIAFKGNFLGVRDGFDDQQFEWTQLINSTFLEKNDNFDLFEDNLLPEYNYLVSIRVVIEDAPLSSEKTYNFTSPAGIPAPPNMTYRGDVDVFAAPNPTESAFVRFAADLLYSDMGKIIYVALLVSEKNCQKDPVPEYALINSPEYWPDVPSWRDVHDQKCIPRYQTTPIRWSPTPVDLSNFRTTRVVQYVIGNGNCTGDLGYCNGPLRPGTEYAVVIRLFTSTGYSDAHSLYFHTDSRIEIYYILLMIIACLLIAFLLGFVYLWITKKIVWHGEAFRGVEEHTGDITSKNFLEYYDEIIKSDKVTREFKELTAISNELNLSNLASTSNETKNRYSNISPYDKNRVMLDCDSDGADYINASFINGYKRRKEYIATQGPKPETFVDFWRMILQYNVRVIVMVTQFREGDTIKCHQYYPFLNKEMRFGHNITVTCKREWHYENYEKRELLLQHFGDFVSRTVTHYFFRRWPDHECPDEVEHLIEFVRKVKHEKIPRHSPIVVHCSAGVGRTGTFIGLDFIMQRLKAENRISIYDTVKELRFQRMKMVQTIQQYQFLYKCAYHLVKKKNSSRHCNKSKPSNNNNRHVGHTVTTPTTTNPVIVNDNGVINTLVNGKNVIHAESIM